MALTTAQLVTGVRQKWGQTTADSGGILDADIVLFLNMRQTELCSESNILLTSWTGATIASQEMYSVPTDYHRVQAVFIYQTTGENIKTKLEPIGINDRDPTKTTGQPRNYFLWGGNLSTGDNSYAIGLSPIPDASGTADLEVWARQIPKTMVSGAQAPEVNQEWQYGIVWGALVDIYLRLIVNNRGYTAPLQYATARWEEVKEAASEFISAHTLDTPGQIRQVSYL